MGQAALRRFWAHGMAQRGMGIAAIGGKDSMSGTFRDITVPPTVCSFAICTSTADEVISREFKQAGQASSIYWILPGTSMALPVFEDVKEKYDRLHELMRRRKNRMRLMPWSGAAFWRRPPRWALGNGIGCSVPGGYLLEAADPQELWRHSCGSRRRPRRRSGIPAHRHADCRAGNPW